ncbi:MAG: radical SAM protein [Anaerolineae bacterium]|nr:radical SAM protein [Anaerolineae bacterium]
MGDCACHTSNPELRWEGSRLAFVFLELTPACNNRCIGCSNVFATQRVSAPLTGDTWIDMIRRLRPYIRWLKLTGGEPTLHPDFEAIVAFLNQEGIPFRLLTNGRWIAPARILDLLVASPALESLLISLHGPDAGSHEAFSGVPGSFAEAVTTIREASDAGLLVATSTVITQYNWNSVTEMWRFAMSLGADHAVFNRYIGSPLPELEATGAETASAIQQVEALIAEGQNLRLGTPVPQCVVPNNTQQCLGGKAFVTVDPWGRVRPCNHAPVVVGDLLSQSAADVLSSSELAEWRAYFTPVCAHCAALLACGGGCRAEWMLRDDKFQDVLFPKVHLYAPA